MITAATPEPETDASPLAIRVAVANPPPPPIQTVDFVSEADVRSAVLRREKIYLAPKSIVTPSARDLGDAHDIFVLTALEPQTRS